MGKGPNYRVAYRRRRENKTDYAARRILATGEHPRFVVRVSNKTINAQIVESKIEGDYELVQTSSHDLKEKYGWIANGKNIPAAYLIGYLMGWKAQKKGIEYANLDLGLKRRTYGNKVFAVVKGANDAGLDIPIDTDVVPSQKAITGQVIADYAKNIKDPFEYERRFSVYLRSGLRPETLPKHFEQIKEHIKEKYDE